MSRRKITRRNRQSSLPEIDLDLSTFDGEGIDVDELVAEELTLAVPDHILCSENCKGICATCGADRNLTSVAVTAKKWIPAGRLKELVDGK